MRRLAVRVSGLSGVLLVLCVVYVLIEVRGAREELRAAQASAVGAVGALQAGDLTLATAEMNDLDQRFDEIARRMSNPLVRIARLLPVAGRCLDGVAEAASAGRALTARGDDLLEAVQAMPGGRSSLGPRAGRLPLRELQALRDPLDAVLREVGTTRHRLARNGFKSFPAPLARAALRADEALASVERQAIAASALLRAWPSLLGVSGPRRYFFGAANPAESRGSGGLIGAYTIVTVDDGTVRFGDFAPVQDLPHLPAGDIDPPNSDFAARYDQYGGAGYWLNLTMTPDFPSAASAMERLYERTLGERLDGVIVADPHAFRALLDITGPVHVAPFGWVSAGNVVRVLANEAFGAFATQAERKQLMGAVAARVFQDFLEGTPGRDPVRSLQALATAASQGHLLLHAVDPHLQGLLEQAGIAGELLDPPGDFLSVVGQNGSATKLDFYAERDITYDVALETDGSGMARVTTTLHNTAPATGQPAYVIGPNAAGLQAGENVTILNVYCARDCAVHRFERNGTPEPLRAEQELGHPVFWSYERLRSGESVDLAYAWLLPRAWASGGDTGRYQFTFQNQVSIRPTRFRIRIALPPRMELLHATPGVRQEGDRLVWQGVPRDDLQLDVRFRIVPGRFHRWTERVLEGWTAAGPTPAPSGPVRERDKPGGESRPADGKAQA